MLAIRRPALHYSPPRLALLGHFGQGTSLPKTIGTETSDRHPCCFPTLVSRAYDFKSGRGRLSGADKCRRVKYQRHSRRRYFARISNVTNQDQADTAKRTSPLIPGVLGCRLPSASITWLSNGIRISSPPAVNASPSTSTSALLVPASCHA